MSNSVQILDCVKNLVQDSINLKQLPRKIAHLEYEWMCHEKFALIDVFDTGTEQNAAITALQKWRMT